MILVTGAIGTALTALLADGGHPFRVICRRQEDDLRSWGIDAVRCHFDDLASVRAAMKGCDQPFLIPPFTQAPFEQSRQTIDTARERGVRHVLKISAADATPHSPMPWAADHGRAAAYLAGSGLASPTCGLPPS